MAGFAPIQSIYSFLLAFTFFTSSNAQTSSKRQDQILRTQGTASAVVSCEMLDRDGNLWFSIKGEGAYRFDGKTFMTFSRQSN